MPNERTQRIIDHGLVVPTALIFDFRPEPVENVTVKTDSDPDLLPGGRHDGSASGLAEIIFRFHIVEPLTVSLSVRDDADAVTAPRVHHNQDATKAVHSYRHASLFSSEILLQCHRVGILEHTEGVGETDPVLCFVLFGFGLIPTQTWH